jgi:hypothetical protein
VTGRRFGGPIWLGKGKARANSKKRGNASANRRD